MGINPDDLNLLIEQATQKVLQTTRTQVINIKIWTNIKNVQNVLP